MYTTNKTQRQHPLITDVVARYGNSCEHAAGEKSKGEDKQYHSGLGGRCH